MMLFLAIKKWLRSLWLSIAWTDVPFMDFLLKIFPNNKGALCRWEGLDYLKY